MENSEYKGKEKIKNTIISVIFIIWFVGSIVAMFALPKYCIMIIGQYFLVFGILPMFGKGKGKIIGIPFILVGLSCIIVPYLMMQPEINGVVIDWDAVIPLLIIIAFVLAGLALIIIPIIKLNKIKGSDEILHEGKNLVTIIGLGIFFLIVSVPMLILLIMNTEFIK